MSSRESLEIGLIMNKTEYGFIIMHRLSAKDILKEFRLKRYRIDISLRF